MLIFIALHCNRRASVHQQRTTLPQRQHPHLEDSMLTLCGFAASNYYNKVRLALMEKGVPFNERLAWIDRSAALIEQSPLGKNPYFEIDDAVLCESQVMLDYV